MTDRDGEQHRRQHDQAEGGHDKVETVLQHPARAAQPGMADLQHGQAIDQADAGAVDADVQQGAGHHEVNLVTLQLPGQAPQRGTVELRAGQHDHGIRSGLLHRRCDLVERAETPARPPRYAPAGGRPPWY